MDWKYLDTEPFYVRQAIAVSWLIGIPDIVEIGGYKTPIWKFMWPMSGHYHQITVIDPLLEDEERNDEIRHWRGIKGMFQEHMHELPESNFGLLILGLDIQGEIEPLYELIEHSFRVIIEFPPDYEPSVRQFEAIMVNTNKQVKMQVNLDLSNNPMPDMSGSWHPRFVRNMYLLE